MVIRYTDCSLALQGISIILSAAKCIPGTHKDDTYAPKHAD